MNDRPTDSENPNRKGAAARLTEVLAQAQAAARAGDDAGAFDDLGDVAEPPISSSPPERSLRERIEELEPVDATDDAGYATRTQTRTPSRWPLLSVIVVLVLAVPVLVVTGYRLTRRSTNGVVVSGTTRPQDPGYLALVQPTPVALVMLSGKRGEASSLAMLALDGPGGKGGVVITLPVNTRLSVPQGDVKTFGGVVEKDDAQHAGVVLGQQLGLGFSDVLSVTDAELTKMIQPVSPLKIDNPNDVTTPDGEFIPAGTVSLSAAEVPGYLAASSSDGSVESLMNRQGLVWAAWIAAITSAHSRPGVVPGETHAGLGRYLVDLAAGNVSTATVPTIAANDIAGKKTVDFDPSLTRLMVANAVPFPVGAAPGARVTVSLLNGTGPGSAPVAVLQRLTYMGAQIVSVGNASRFGVDETTITYSDDQTASFAALMRSTLGVGKVVHVRNADPNPQITIIMGKDLLSNPPERLTVKDVQD